MFKEKAVNTDSNTSSYLDEGYMSFECKSVNVCLFVRFRRDAANLLDVLSVYQKRQIVEFLPYHHCDMNHHSPDLHCLIELQARYTQYRHTIFLTGTYTSAAGSSSTLVRLHSEHAAYLDINYYELLI